jgi:uncharacterized damage-inducible protein DinB
MDKEQAHSQITKSRKELVEAIQGLNEVDITHPQVEGIWTIKDILGHVAAWEEACLRPLECITNGKPIQSEDISDHDAWNAMQAARRHNKPLKTILKELDDIRQKLLCAASQLSDEEWNIIFHLPWGEKASAANMLSGLAWHEAEHTKSIWSWRNR